ncbi:MAG: T9SS type A sorting domain-containing protein [candidate division WOR-3 bacterium]
MWTQQQECLANNTQDGYIQFVCRNFAIGGNLDVWQSDYFFITTLSDENVYSGQLGSARYPHSIPSPNGMGPHISAPVLITGAWGAMMGQYEIGGWFSSLWNQPVDLAGNVWAHKCIAKQLSNGNILFIGITSNYEILYRTYTPNLDSLIAYGVVSPATSHYFGYDINCGIAYVFWYNDQLNVYYKTTTDGINWSQTQIYNLVWPQPFTQNVFYWGQMAVTDAGNPILVFDIIDGSDSEYPYIGKVYVSTAPGQPCIEVGITTQGAENFYPTIATGGNCVVVLFGETRSGSGQYTFWDIYYNYSADNGLTWHTPINLTASITDHNNCLWQIAKRFSSYAFFVFGSAISDPMLDLYWDINNGGAHYARWYVGRFPDPGISENSSTHFSKYEITISPNPANTNTTVSYSLPIPNDITLKVYSADGRLCQILYNGYQKDGNYKVNLLTRNLANGTYFIVLDSATRRLQKSIVVTH